MQVVQHNIASQFTNRQLNIVTGKKAKSTEKLSSGYKINRSADDAAGLAISEKMRWQIRGLNRASENIQDGISFVQTGEGALNEVHSMLQRIRELAVQASNDTNTDQDRAAIDEEIQQIKKDTQRVFDDTMFNNTYIFRAPYLPDIETPPNDYKFFNIGNSTTVGGIMVNNKRYTWDELGVPQNPSTEWNKEFTDDNGELIRLKLNAGDDRTQLRRVYELDANDQGILINNLLAATWDDTIHQDGDKYSFSYHGMDISFTADAGASRQDVISHLKPDGISGITWDAVATGQSGSKAVASTADTMTLYATDTNKGAILNYRFSVNANDTGVYVTRTNTANPSDTQTGNVTAWESFTDKNDTNFNIKDWGTVSDNANPVTIDDTAVYAYSDGTSWDGKTSNNLAFDFSFVIDEVSKAEAIKGLTQTLDAPSMYAPYSVVATSDNGGTVRVDGRNHYASYNFQRDSLLRVFGANGTELNSMTATVTREKKIDGTVTDYEERRELSKAYVRKDTTTVVETTTTLGTSTRKYYDDDWNEITDVPALGTITQENAGTVTGFPATTRTSNTVNEYEDNIGQKNNTGSTTNEEDARGASQTADGTFTYVDTSGVTHTGKIRDTYETNVHTTTTVSYAYSSNDFVQSGGNYISKGTSNVYYVYGGDDRNSNAQRDVNGDFNYALTDNSSTEQRYLQTGSDWKENKVYNLAHYEYSVTNSNGDEILRRSSGLQQFIDTGSGITDSAADLAKGGSYVASAENVQDKITLHNSRGTEIKYDTDQASRTVSFSDTSGTNYMTLVYNDHNDSTGAKNEAVTLTYTPTTPATATFAKAARVAGDASSTNLKVQMNPPEKLLHIQAGALGFQDIPLRWNALTNTIVGISGARTLDYGQSQAAIQLADDAIGYISDIRAKFGAYQNRLEYAYSIDQNTSENTSAAESRIRDTDMAKEMVDYSKHDILAQAGQAMLSQANQQPQGILSLLQ